MKTCYASLPQIDLEMQTTDGKGIHLITLSKEINKDGSPTRRKETTLFDSTTLINELSTIHVCWEPMTIRTPDVIVCCKRRKREVTYAIRNLRITVSAICILVLIWALVRLAFLD